MARSFRVTFPTKEAPVFGALDLTPGTHGGVGPRRLPAWTRRQITDPAFDFVVGMGSGLRIATQTSASELELELVVIGIDPSVGRTEPAMVQLAIDGVVVESRVFDHHEQLLVDGTGATTQDHGAVRAIFENLGPDDKGIELWLPHSTSMELISLSSDAPLHAPADTRPRWVHHGSSISQCGEATQPTFVWPVVAAHAANVHVQSLGFSGNAVADPFVARTIRDLPADMISLEIGINVINGDLMRRRMFESVLHGFLDTVRDGHPNTPLLLIGPIPCPAHELMPGPTQLNAQTGQCESAGRFEEVARGSMNLAAVREALASVLAARSDDPHLHYLDGRMLLTEDEVGDLPDGLHPHSDAYVRMGSRFAAIAFGVGGAFRAGGAGRAGSAVRAGEVGRA